MWGDFLQICKRLILIILSFILFISFIHIPSADSAHSVSSRSFSSLSDEEYNLLLNSVSAESGGETYECQRAVAEVMLNRIDSTRFPNTLRDVIYAPGQFSIVDNGSINRQHPSQRTIQAVNEALTTRTLPDDVLYFNSIGFFTWVVPYDKIDHMYFSSVTNNQVKKQICINDITFYGSKDSIYKISELFNMTFDKQNSYGSTWYGNYLKQIGIQISNDNSKGYINSVSIPDSLEGKYYIQLRTYTDNDVAEQFLKEIAEHYDVNYAYMSTNPTSRDNYIYDQNKLFYKYNYLVILNLNNTEISKYLKNTTNVVEYLNKKMFLSLDNYDEALNYMDSLSDKEGISVIYEYQNKI